VKVCSNHLHNFSMEVVFKKIHGYKITRYITNGSFNKFLVLSNIGFKLHLRDILILFNYTLFSQCKK
jgi:hypothetical protein